MNKQLKLAGSAVLLALLALPGMGRALAAQVSNPIQTAQALAAAQNANDPAGMRAVIAPTATFIQPVETGGEIDGREDFIASNTGAHNSHVSISNVQQTAADTVEADAVLSGGDIPSLPHPFTIHIVFTVQNGLITHAVITLSPQTHQDVLPLLAPGMPTTGQSAGWLAPSMMALAALSLSLGGLALRKRGRAAR